MCSFDFSEGRLDVFHRFVGWLAIFDLGPRSRCKFPRRRGKKRRPYRPTSTLMTAHPRRPRRRGRKNLRRVERDNDDAWRAKLYKLFRKLFILESREALRSTFKWNGWRAAETDDARIRSGSFVFAAAAVAGYVTLRDWLCTSREVGKLRFGLREWRK